MNEKIGLLTREDSYITPRSFQILLHAHVHYHILTAYHTMLIKARLPIFLKPERKGLQSLFEPFQVYRWIPDSDILEGMFLMKTVPPPEVSTFTQYTNMLLSYVRHSPSNELLSWKYMCFL